MGWLRQDVPVVHPDFGKAVRCRCQLESDKLRAYARAQRASNLTDKLLDKRFDTYKPTPQTRDAFDHCQAFARRPAGWLYLYGTRGTGKSHLLAAIANVLLHTTARPLYVVYPDWLDYVRAGYEASGGNVESAHERMQAAKTIPVLLLDDIGAENRSKWTDEHLYKLLNARYDANLPTVIASNLHPDKLEERVASRVQDVDMGDVIALGGPDYRRRPRLMTLPMDGQEQQQQEAGNA